MVQALFGEVKGFFDKDFLFAAFIPTLVFIASIAATLAGMVGFEGTLAWIDSLTVAQSTTLISVVFLGTVVLAYIFHSLRVVFLKLWTGAIKTPIAPLLLLSQRWNETRFDEQAKAAFRTPAWRDLIDQFDCEVRKSYQLPGSANQIPDDQLHSLESTLKTLQTRISNISHDDASSQKTIEAAVKADVLPFFNKFGWSDSLNAVYQELVSVLEKKAGEERANIVSRRFQLDRRFGTRDTIQPTTLGNVVESYNTYPFVRYGMEGEIFWPHLQHHISEPFMKKIDEQKIIFDFCLTMATLGVSYGLLALVFGPLLWANIVFWTILGLFAVAFSYVVYYRLAVSVATQYGDLIRASFDLFRHDLLKAFSVKFDPLNLSLSEEKEIWSKLSRLLVYGDASSLMFEIPRSAKTP
ncbi:MAG: hypothetical protein KA426_01265 [Nitrospira sp.]|nr:hypothetical protein [Nitrospira sp.]HQY58250.1 hypothetical protein [Nitrospira sp.]